MSALPSWVAEGGGHRFEVYELGEQHIRTLVLLHSGLADAAQSWEPVMRALAEQFHVVAPNLPGIGASTPLAALGWEDWLRWLAALRDALALEEIALAGHGFGAVLARLYAAAHPTQVPALIMIHGGQMPRPAALPLRWAARSDWLGTRVFGAVARSGLNARGLAWLARADALDDAFMASAQASAPALTATFRTVAGWPTPKPNTPHVPTLLLWGENDPDQPPPVARALQAHMPGAQLVLMAGCRAMPQREEPEVVAHQVRAFLEPLAGLSPARVYDSRPPGSDSRPPGSISRPPGSTSNPGVGGR